MKELTGVEATSQILRNSPRTAVLILSMHRDEWYVIRSVRAGALGYILKDSVEHELIRAIQVVRRGGHFFSPAIAQVVQEGYERLKKSTQVEDRYELLTDRERVIYQMLAEGNSNKDIANRLNISVHTVETHRAHVMEKLEVHTTAELVLSAVRRGIVS
jgi:DNA-binding NarL/FixJ family response regulator